MPVPKTGRSWISWLIWWNANLIPNTFAFFPLYGQHEYVHSFWVQPGERERKKPQTSKEREEEKRICFCRCHFLYSLYIRTFFGWNEKERKAFFRERKERKPKLIARPNFVRMFRKSIIPNPTEYFANLVPRNLESVELNYIHLANDRNVRITHCEMFGRVYTILPVGMNGRWILITFPYECRRQRGHSFGARWIRWKGGEKLKLPYF